MNGQKPVRCIGSDVESCSTITANGDRSSSAWISAPYPRSKLAVSSSWKSSCQGLIQVWRISIKDDECTISTRESDLIGFWRKINSCINFCRVFWNAIPPPLSHQLATATLPAVFRNPIMLKICLQRCSQAQPPPHEPSELNVGELMFPFVAGGPWSPLENVKELMMRGIPKPKARWKAVAILYCLASL